MNSGLDAVVSKSLRYASVFIMATLTGVAHGNGSAASPEGYQVPSDVVAKMVAMEVFPDADISPDRHWLILTHRSGLAGIDELAAPSLLLPGVDIDLRTNGPHADSSARGIGMTLIRLSDTRQWKLSVPEQGLSAPMWSPDSKHFLFRRTTKDGVELWVGTASTGEVRLVGGGRLLALFGASAPCAWMPDSQRVLCHEIPEGRGPAPAADSQVRPKIRESGGVRSRGFVFAGYLGSTRDVALYEHYRTSQLVLIDVRDGHRARIGSPGIYDFVSVSPNGEYLLSIRSTPPYSSQYAEEYRFPKEVAVLDMQGNKIRTLLTSSAGHWGNIYDEGWAQPSLRRFSWAPFDPATISYIEALDEGDPHRAVRHRDRLLRLDAPFTGPGVELIRTQGRMAVLPESVRFTKADDFSNVAWLADGTAWVEEIDPATHRKRTWLVELRADRSRATLLMDSSLEGDRADAGIPILRTGTSRWTVSTAEAPVVFQSGDWIYLEGRERSNVGERPFLDRFNLKTRRRTRLLQSGDRSYERFLAVLGDSKVLTRYETPQSPPNYYIRDLKRGASLALTHMPHPAPELRESQSRMLNYTRDDGVSLNGELWLPVGYQPGQRVPVLIWAYPRTYSDDSVARPGVGSPQSFRLNPRSEFDFMVRSLIAHGYAVLWEAGMPVVGDAQRYDTAVSQLVANARAAVDELVRIGVADRSRIAIAGHSHGGAMTAVLLANSDYFCAGIALSGVFNFTNHPQGFGNEPRTLWEAPKVYEDISALFRADKIRAPLLLIHGEQDDNFVARSSESERMYQALNSLGREARLVILPYEGHGFKARESVAHMAWEIVNWLDRYAKPGEDQAPVNQSSRTQTSQTSSLP